MPTSPLPAEPHRAREMAESFGIDAERYDRTRPRYPQELVTRIVAAAPGREVLDVGCGTGIAARQFQAIGCRVLGVDADGRMAEFARRSGLDVEVARFEEWEPAGRTFDAVIAGQTWHWIDPVAGAAKAAQLLRAGGRVALFRSDPELPARLTRAFADVYHRLLPGLPLNPHRLPDPADRAATALSQTAIDGLRQAGAFNEPEQWTFEWQRTYTRDEWLDALPTTGLLTRLDPATLQAFVSTMGAAIDHTTIGGGFVARYTTVCVTAKRGGV